MVSILELFIRQRPLDPSFAKLLDGIPLRGLVGADHFLVLL